ncbi:MAG: hypothetical protein CW346_08710 [Bacillaceae bacterium]|nr:hypothetical protein [Bacillaceae bacterium]
MTKTPLIRQLGLAVLLMTIAAGPFFQGYFFPMPTLIATAVVAVAFMIWMYGRRTDRVATLLVDGWSDRSLLALAGWVFLVTLWSIYARGTIDLLLSSISAYLVYLMIRQESSASTRAWIVRVLGAVAFVVAVIGLLEYSGFFMQFPAIGDLLQIEPQKSRMYTLFQYPNTAAAFFVATLILLNAALAGGSSRTETLSLAAISGIVSVAFLFTLSRGGVIIAPVAVLLLWSGLTRPQIGRSLLDFVTAVLMPTGAVLYPILRAAQTDNWILVLLWTALAGLIGAVATWAGERLAQRGRHAQITTAAALIILMAVGGGAAARALRGELPRVWSRITQLSASDLTSNARFEYLTDAVKLAVRRPWGYGGGGWVRAYPQVQTVHYVARDPHSHYALLLVEAGTPGLLLTLAPIIFSAYTAFRVRKEEPVRWALAAAAITLAVHAAIDIDLSYYMMWLLLWTLLGAAQPDVQPAHIKREKRYTFPVALCVALPVLILSLTLASAAWSYNAAETAAILGDNDTALRLGSRAIRLDPLNSQYRTLIPTAKNIQRALELDPNNEELWRFVSDLVEEQGDAASALAAAKRSLELRPMSVTHYERVAGFLAAFMTTALEDGNYPQATAYATELIALGDEVTKRAEASLEKQTKTFYSYAPLEWTSSLNLAVGQAYFVIGDEEAAETRLTAALADDQTANTAALWLHALYTRLANQEALENLRPWPSERALNSRLYDALMMVG